jgi:hypothetical protein
LIVRGVFEQDWANLLGPQLPGFVALLARLL